MKVAIVGVGDMGGAIASKAPLRHTITVRGSRTGSPAATAIVENSKGRIAEASDDDIAAAGPLYAVRFTETMGFLWTAITFEGGAGDMVAFRAVFPR